MPLRPDLLAEIRNRLATISMLNLTSASAASDIFEAYVFSVVVEAAQREGAQVSYEDIFGNTTDALVFRTSPGRIFASGVLAVQPLYTHAVLDFPDCPAVEVHQGIYVSGKSGLLHECDVAVIFRSEGETCRRERVNPRYARAILTAECKYYSSTLGIALARGHLGLTTDLATTGRFFISNTSSTTLEKLLTHHKRIWENGVIPGNARVVNRLRAHFEEQFKGYKTRYEGSV